MTPTLQSLSRQQKLKTDSFISFTDPVLAVVALGASLIVLAAMLYVALRSRS